MSCAGLRLYDGLVLAMLSGTPSPRQLRPSCAGCSSSPVGRVRVALDGLNATLGGSMAALRQHAAVVQERFGDLAAGPPIDFKLAVNRGRKNDAAVAGSKFDRLTVAACKEVVSMSPLGGLAGAATDQGASGLDAAQGVLPAGARHVEPAEFHAMLAEAAAGRRDAGGKPTVLIDARNYYETRIGRFDAVRSESPLSTGVHWAGSRPPSLSQCKPPAWPAVAGCPLPQACWP